MKTWHLETRKIKDLLANSKNPRYIKKEMAQHLNDSIAKFGLIDKPIITKDNLIIGGHQRIKTLKKMKYKEVECWVCDEDLTDEEMEELNIKLNKVSGDWDYDILANQFDIDKLFDYGFTIEELLDTDVTQIDSEDTEEDNEVLEPSKDPITKPGNIYELGNHRLMCGDSTNPDDVKALLNGNEPILMVTDPPYGVNYDPEWRKENNKKQRGISRKGKVKNDDNANWSLSYFLFPGSIVYIWHADKMSHIITKNLEDCEFELKYQIIWKKQKGFNRGDYHYWHEPCWYAVKKSHKHNWQGARDQNTIWEINTIVSDSENPEEGKTNHSTQKPIECMARPIRNNTAIGEGVYDPFVGSGTTIIAAEKLNRVCYAMEIDPGYCDIAVARWEKLTGKKGILIKNNCQIDSQSDIS